MDNSGARILVICYANICRSPAAAALLAGRLGPSVEVVSRGVHAFAGAGICPASATWATTYGGAPTASHTSTQLEIADVRSATLILTASRSQRDHVVALRPAAQACTFTIAQAGRIAGRHHGRGARPPVAGLPDRVRWLTEQLNEQLNAHSAAELVGPMVPDELDDVPDPHRGGTHAEAFKLITAAVDTLCRGL